MFTGIITEIGTVVVHERAHGVQRLRIHAPKTAVGLALGESVAVNGVCLSVVQVRQGTMQFEMIPETRRLTTLGRLSVGARVNVEPSLNLTDRLNGHLLLGHVDGVGEIVRRAQEGGQLILGIRVNRQVRRYLTPKAPLAVDGVSLTLGARLSSTTCTVFLIPETMRKTTLGSRRVGDLVNLEIDYVAKLVAQFLQR